MKIIFSFLVFVAIFISPMWSQDKVFISQWSSGSHRDMMYVNTPQNADICINVVCRELELKYTRHSWLITRSPSEADIVLRLVNSSNGNRNAIRVYVNKSPAENRSHKWVRNYKLFKSGCIK